MSSCSEDKRITINIIETKNGYYEWYYYSLITEISPDHIDFIDKNCNRTSVFEGEGVYNLRIEKDKLAFDCFLCDTMEFNRLYSESVKILYSTDTLFFFGKAKKDRDSLERNASLKKYGCE